MSFRRTPRSLSGGVFFLLQLFLLPLGPPHDVDVRVSVVPVCRCRFVVQVQGEDALLVCAEKSQRIRSIDLLSDRLQAITSRVGSEGNGDGAAR